MLLKPRLKLQANPFIPEFITRTIVELLYYEQSTIMQYDKLHKMCDLIKSLIIIGKISFYKVPYW